MLTVKSKHNGLTFNVRIIRKGEKYGRDNCLTHNREKALVEFYDSRYKTGGFDPEAGQFVARYHSDTLLGLDQYSDGSIAGRGLNLDMGITDWQIDADAATEVVSWLESELSPGSTLDAMKAQVAELEKELRKIRKSYRDELQDFTVDTLDQRRSAYWFDRSYSERKIEFIQDAARAIAIRSEELMVKQCSLDVLKRAFAKLNTGKPEPTELENQNQPKPRSKRSFTRPTVDTWSAR